MLRIKVICEQNCTLRTVLLHRSSDVCACDNETSLANGE